MKPKSTKNPEGTRYIDESETYNLTHLSPLKEFARGRLIHRDFNAHVFRWLYSAKEIFKNSKRDECAVLDIACGPDWPQLTVMHSNGCMPGYYKGIDLRDCSTTMPSSKSAVIEFEQVDITKQLPAPPAWNKQIGPTNADGTAELKRLGGHWDMIVCFEVLEHMPKASGLKLLDGITAAMSDKTQLVFSTPVFDPHVGMAENHLYEWGYEELKGELESRFTLENHYGTFASLKDYTPLMSAEELKLLAKLKEYYNSAMVASIMAPLYPQASRNVLWSLKKKS